MSSSSLDSDSATTPRGSAPRRRRRWTPRIGTVATICSWLGLGALCSALIWKCETALQAVESTGGVPVFSLLGAGLFLLLALAALGVLLNVRGAVLFGTAFALCQLALLHWTAVAMDPAGGWAPTLTLAALMLVPPLLVLAQRAAWRYTDEPGSWLQSIHLAGEVPLGGIVLLGGVLVAVALLAQVVLTGMMERPDFELTQTQLATEFQDLSGNSRTLTSDGSKLTVVNFWATWCAPCVHELPMLGELQRELATEGIEVVLVNVDLQDPSAIQSFLDQHEAGHVTCLVDAPTGFWGSLELGALPTTVLIDSQGSVRRTLIGGMSKMRATTAIRSALSAPPAGTEPEESSSGL